MATIDVKDAAGVTRTIEAPNTNGRAAATASRPVALSTEDLAAIDAIATALADNATGADIATVVAALVDVATGADVATVVAALADVSTGADIATVVAALNALTGSEYETVAASATNQALGAAGATGDLLESLLVTPASTSPGAVQIKDGPGAAITVFAGGTDSVSTLHPFSIPLGIRSGAGAWQVTTGANVSVIASGNFS